MFTKKDDNIMQIKIGFEIHQQLDTTKLFCKCPSILREEKVNYTILRSLRPTQSELGQVDQAALKESQKGKKYLYQGYNDTTCLVEIDEEPPHTPNDMALDIGIEISRKFNSRIVDEVHFMRKLVIDGSTTSGFQRTAIIAQDGYLNVKTHKIPIDAICLEEEAARKIHEENKQIIFRLDRLGIPLVEITTAPTIYTPKEALETARTIGEILRSTGKVRRGIGTIRQDINVSIEKGARVEIKGVQDLNLIPMVITKEAERQKMLLQVQKDLIGQKISKDMLKLKIVDVTHIFKKSDSDLVKRLLSNGVALAFILPGFKGQLKGKLGPEIAAYARVISDVKGILHSDELPGYGITQQEVKDLSVILGMGSDDAFILAIAQKIVAKKALEAGFERAQMSFHGVIEETRVAHENGTSSYMRPLPGAARMYPETDIPPIVLSKERIKKIESDLTESYEKKKRRYLDDYGLSPEMASQLLAATIANKPSWKIYDKILETTDYSPRIVAETLLGTFPRLIREGYQLHEISIESLKLIFKYASTGEIVKDAISPLLVSVSNNPDSDVKDLIDEVIKDSFTEDQLRHLIQDIIKKKKSFIKEKKDQAIKPLMGLIMKEVRGKIDGRLVNQLLREELDKFSE